MAEYVEKKDVKAVMKRRLGKMDLFESLFNADVDAMPAADVAPVVHGCYVTDEYGDSSCSVCNEKWLNHTQNYCPNCGCRMDGGSE